MLALLFIVVAITLSVTIILVVPVALHARPSGAAHPVKRLGGGVA